VRLMSALGSDGIDGGSDNTADADLIPMMQGMMKSLLSKDVLYPSLKDISAQVSDISFDCLLLIALYRVGQKMAPFLAHLIVSPNINQFSEFFHLQNQKTICNKTITIDPTTPQMCRYTTL